MKSSHDVAISDFRFLGNTASPRHGYVNSALHFNIMLYLKDNETVEAKKGVYLKDSETVSQRY